MKKQYPSTVVMRKRLIVIAVISLLGLMGLIVHNLWSSTTNNTHAPATTSAATQDMAAEADTAWFKDKQVSLHPQDAPAIVTTALHSTSLAAGDSAAQPILELDQKAMQAPISSNQIRSESVNSSAQSNASIAKETSTAPTDTAHKNEKVAFLQEQQQGSPDYLPNRVKNPLSRYELKTGAIIPGILITGINSDLPGPITAQVRENVYDTITGRYLLIPQGAKLQGTYDSSVAYGQQRTLIVWQRLIFPNGQSLKLAGMPGVDASGYAGFHDQTNNHLVRLFGSSLLMSLISAGVQLSQPQQQSDNNGNITVNQTLAQNLGISLSQTADMLIRKNMNIQPTLEIRPGYLFNISVTQDIVFPDEYHL